MFQQIRRPSARDDRGATAVEYALIVVGIAIALVVGVAFVGSRVSSGLTAAGDGLTGEQPVAMGQSPAEQAAAEQAAAEQAAAEQAAAEQAAAEQALRDAQEKAAADQAAAEAAAKAAERRRPR